MSQNQGQQQNLQSLKDTVVSAMQEKKAKQIIALDLISIDSAPTDFYIICHGNSDRQVDAIYDEVERTVKEDLGENPWHTEGTNSKEWVLMDYVNVVVHIFLRDKRQFYNIEDLWSDANRTDYESEA